MSGWGLGDHPARERCRTSRTADAHAANLRDVLGVIPAYTRPTPERGRTMFNAKLKPALVGILVTAGLLVAAVPASAGTFVGNPT